MTNNITSNSLENNQCLATTKSNKIILYEITEHIIQSENFSDENIANICQFHLEKQTQCGDNISECIEAIEQLRKNFKLECNKKKENNVQSLQKNLCQHSSTNLTERMLCTRKIIKALQRHGIRYTMAVEISQIILEEKKPKPELKQNSEIKGNNNNDEIENVKQMCTLQTLHIRKTVNASVKKIHSEDTLNIVNTLVRAVISDSAMIGQYRYDNNLEKPSSSYTGLCCCKRKKKINL